MKKGVIFLTTIILILAIIVIPNQIHADSGIEEGNLNLILEETQNDEELTTEEGILEDENESTDEVSEQLLIEETEEVVTENEVIETRIDSTKEVSITTEEQLKQAIANATNGSTIIIQGGSVIPLSASLIIDSAKLSSLSFVSSDDQEVILQNADMKRHIQVNGTQAVQLSFENIVFSGPTDMALNGGIAITNNAIGNVIDGIVFRNNKGFTKSWEQGLISYAGSNGDFTLRNALFDGNGIVSRTAVSASTIFLDGNNSNMTLENVTFTNTNNANQNGGVIGIYASGGITKLQNVTITGTQAKSMSAGVKYTGSKDATLYIDNSSFTSNTNSEGTAGAIYVRLKDSSNMEFTNSIVEGNFAERGGAGMYVHAETSGAMTLDHVDFIENKSSMIEYNEETGEQTGLPSSGGAINVQQMSSQMTFNLNQVNLLRNQANSGGALYIYNDYGGKTQLNLNNSVIDSNLSNFMGGGIVFNNQNDENTDGLYQITNTTITNNEVSGKEQGPGYLTGGEGGAIYADMLGENPDLLILDSVTFSNNRSTVPFVWNYVEDGTSYYDMMYSRNVSNTTFSDVSQYDHIPAYNNAYNGDDVYFDYTGIAYFYLNPDNLDDLVVDNYDTTKEYHYNYSLTGTSILEPIAPTAEGYEFKGWTDEDGNDWDFNTSIQNEVHQYIYAKWEKLVSSTITIQFVDEANTPISSDITLTGFAGEVQKYEIPTIKGYTYLKQSLTKASTIDITFTKLDQTITLIYKSDIVVPKTSTVTVLYQNEDGDEISPMQLISGNVGEAYAYEVPEIDGYTFSHLNLDETHSDTQVFTEAPQTIVVVYRVKSSKPVTSTVVISYVDTDGNEIQEAMVMSGEVGTSYTYEIPTIAGYNYVETKKESTTRASVDGIYVPGGERITIVYEKSIAVDAPNTSNTPNTPTTGVMNQLPYYISVFVVMGGILILIRKRKTQ